MKTAEEIEKEGEFITFSEAKGYCLLHGLDLKISNPVFQIAGALRDARKNERQKVAEDLKSALKECVDDPLFKIHFTVKYHEFKKLLDVE
jgi:hypothetical protein